jgi:Chaperone of endosialidase
MKLQNLIHILIGIVCIGFLPRAQAVVPPPDGGYPGGNTAEGQNALLNLTTGGFNTAVGLFSLRSNTEGTFNTGVGAGTLFVNTADQNTAVGAGALLNTSGGQNTATGAFALFNNTIGLQNTANGILALFNNTTGSDNTASGLNALASNTTGEGNTAVGDVALVSNTTGNFNTALGLLAGSNVITADNVICIGAAGFDVSDSCFIGNIRGASVSPDAIPVFVDSSNKLGTMTSSKRFKKDIKPMDKDSEAILALKPVTFQYKDDKTGTPQFGLVAEEVAEVNPGLIVRDKEGKPYTVRYDAVNAMLLNEFLEEHKAFLEERRTVQEQQATITELKSTVAQQQKDFQATVAQLTARLDEQAAQIQKVSAQLAAASPSRGGLEASKFATGRIRGGGPARQVVNNP